MSQEFLFLFFLPSFLVLWGLVQDVSIFHNTHNRRLLFQLTSEDSLTRYLVWDPLNALLPDSATWHGGRFSHIFSFLFCVNSNAKFWLRSRESGGADSSLQIFQEHYEFL